MITTKRRVRCEHAEKSVLTIAGMMKEVCIRCGEITLVVVDWESEFELAR